MSVARFRQVLAASNASLTALEIAEVLWFAESIAATTPAPATPEAAPISVQPRPRLEDPIAEDATQELPTADSSRAAFYLPQPHMDTANTIKASKHPLPATEALPTVLSLARALRPLKRRQPSRHRFEIDEERTIRNIAERRLWLPVLQPARGRWLSAAIVVDDSGAGALWRDAAKQLHTAFRLSGAFHEVQTFYLRGNPDGGLGLAAQPHTQPRRSTLLSGSGRSLTLVLSDCVGPAWHGGPGAALLAKFARNGPTAILQPLPERLWHRTARPPATARLATSGRGVANADLSLVTYQRRSNPNVVAVPVLEIDPVWIAPWAALVAGAERSVEFAVTMIGDESPVSVAAPPPADISPFDRVLRFRNDASQETYRLAGLLAAATPLTLGLMRTLQAALMPHTTPAHLAELLFSGLLTTQTKGDTDIYEFVDGVRDVLAGTLRRQEAAAVVAEVSAYLQRQLHRAPTQFTALTPDPAGEHDIDPSAKAFAELQPQLPEKVSQAAPPITPERSEQTGQRFGLIAGRYQLRGQLSVGGMGRVWLAYDEMLDRDVAIKEVAPRQALSPEQSDELSRLILREVRATARINHPHVVQIYDVIQTENWPWIVMEYIPSLSLHKVILHEGPLPPGEVAVIGLALLEALNAAHEAGILHRDVKPDNVLIGEDGRVVLTDFGHTSEVDVRAKHTDRVVSPQYFAPERAEKGVSSREADFWSLGATLYAAVEGRSPYQRKTTVETLTLLATQPPDPLTKAGALEPVIMGLLRREPSERLTPAELETALKHFLSMQPAARVRRAKKAASHRAQPPSALAQLFRRVFPRRETNSPPE